MAYVIFGGALLVIAFLVKAIGKTSLWHSPRPGSIYGALAAGALGLGLMGFGLSTWSFDAIEEIRQVERTPRISVASVITGEVNLRGAVIEKDELYASPETNTPSVYYRHVIERRRDDSWTVVRSTSRAANFMLEDATGQIPVQVRNAEINAPMRHRHRSGNRRYTEYRIEPGDTVFMFGYAQQREAGYTVGFEREGAYRPLISTGTALQFRQGRAVNSSLLVLAGTTAFLFAAFALFTLIRVHNAAAYMIGVTTVTVTVLCVQGVLMLHNDLIRAHEATTRVLAEGERAILAILDRHEIPAARLSDVGSMQEPRYEALSDAERQRIMGVRVRMAQTAARTATQHDRIPERFIARASNVPVPPTIALPSDEEDRFAAGVEAAPVRFTGRYALLMLIVGAGGLFFGTTKGFRQVARKRRIENIPTSPVGGVVYGLVELQGRAVAVEGQPSLRGPRSGADCLHYTLKVEKYNTDDGKWVTIRTNRRQVDFGCVDDTGTVHIASEGAEFSCRRTMTEMDSTDRDTFRFTESSIQLGDDVYVMGMAQVNPETHDALFIGASDDTPFIVSGLSADELKTKAVVKGFSFLNIGIVTAMATGIGLAGLLMAVGPALYATMAGLSASYLFLILGLMYYNDLVFLRQRAERNIANIDVALQKRYDLIRNLTSAVERALGHEQTLQEMVARVRQLHDTDGGAAVQQAELQAGDAVRKQLRIAVESTPDLRAHESVRAFMDALEAVENDISFMRTGYNDTAERYNMRIRHFPEVLIALPFGFQSLPFIAEEARGAAPHKAVTATKKLQQE